VLQVAAPACGEQESNEPIRSERVAIDRLVPLADPNVRALPGREHERAHLTTRQVLEQILEFDHDPAASNIAGSRKFRIVW
jgi:hypothetical protein